MESSSNTPLPSKWCNLPSDVLLSIAKKLDENHLRQLGAVCTSWNSSLAVCRPNKPCSNFPLEVPCPIIPSLYNQEKVLSVSKRFSFWVVQRSVVLISPLKNEPETSDVWITTVEESGIRKWSAFNPLYSSRISPCSCSKHQSNTSLLSSGCINLLDFRITEITQAYSLLWVDKQGYYHTHSCSSNELLGYLGIKKVITFQSSSTCAEGEGVTVVLALHVDGKLASWKSGWPEWKMLDFLQPHKSKFVDIICFDDKFHAIDLEGNLTIINPMTLEPIKSIAASYDYDFYAIATYLVECEQLLYLVMFGFAIYTSYDLATLMLRFTLKEQGWVKDQSLAKKCLKDSVFFLGANVSFSVPRKHLGWAKVNIVYNGQVMISSFFDQSCKMDLYMGMGSHNSLRNNFFEEDYDQEGTFYAYSPTSIADYEFYHHTDDYSFVRTNAFRPPPNWVRPEASLKASDACDNDKNFHREGYWPV